MNQLTTIAALPSGAGCAAALKPEVGSKSPPRATGKIISYIELVTLSDGRCSMRVREGERIGGNVIWSTDRIEIGGRDDPDPLPNPDLSPLPNKETA